MARTIDHVIQHVRDMDNSGGMSPTIKQVIINRLEVEPTREELDRAREQLYPTT
jgi:hypothetical protein